MVIINFDAQECSQIHSDKRALHRITKRRTAKVNISALDRLLRDAQTTTKDIDIKDLPDVSYSHLYKSTKHFLSASFERIKNLGRYLNAQGEYCEHCREYRHLFEAQSSQFTLEADLNYLNKAALPSYATQRFSDVFVEKVQSQQQYIPGKPEIKSEALKRKTEEPVKMTSKCCASCRRPHPVELFCGCDETPRRVVVSGCNRPPPTRYYTVQRRKNKGWWCCNKKDSECWNHCHYCHQKIKRPVCPPYMYPYQPDRTFMQRLKQYMKTKCQNSADIDLYNAYVDGCNLRAGLPVVDERRPSCSWCPKAHSNTRRNSAYENLPMRRTRSYSRVPCRASDDDYQLKSHSDEEYVDELDSDSDDCCCCCPCRKCFNTTNCQTEENAVVEPKHMDTQTERCCAKRRCCRCCRKACATCNKNAVAGDRTTNLKCQCPKHRTGKNTGHMCMKRRQECMRDSPESSRTNSPRPRSKCCACSKSKPKTIICKAAGVQHEPSFTGTASFASPGVSQLVIDHCKCSKKNMQNVMFSNVNPNPLFLDKMFTPINMNKSYNLSTNPLDMKLTNHPFLSASYEKDNESVDSAVSSVTLKTKKRFMNAVCDSILSELSSKRRTSFADLVKSPDSGFQESKRKSSLFSSKVKSGSKASKYTMESMIKTLRGNRKNNRDSKAQENVMGEASKVVRGILEEITSTHKESQENNLICPSNTTLQSVSLRNILLNVPNNCNVEQSRSDSMLLEYEITPGTSMDPSVGGADAGGNPSTHYDESYTKLMHALDTMHNKNRKMSKLK